MSYQKDILFDCLRTNRLGVLLKFTVRSVHLRFSEMTCYDTRIIMNFIPLGNVVRHLFSITLHCSGIRLGGNNTMYTNYYRTIFFISD